MQNCDHFASESRRMSSIWAIKLVKCDAHEVAHADLIVFHGSMIALTGMYCELLAYQYRGLA